jgi:hypothetical protein
MRSGTVACVSVQKRRSGPSILAPGAESSALTRPDRGFRAHGALIVPKALGVAVVPKWCCRRPPARHVLPTDQPLANDLLTFCMMVPHSSDNRCASALAISTRCKMHS